MAVGRAERRRQLIIWAVGEANRLRREALPLQRNGIHSSTSLSGSWIGQRAGESVVPGRAPEPSGLVVDWQLPSQPAPDVRA